MGQVLYGSATTTQAVRLAIQRSEAELCWKLGDGVIRRRCVLAC